MRRMSSDLDQQVNVTPVPLGSPGVRGVLDQQVDVTPIPLGSPRVRGRPPPPSLSSLSSPPPPDSVRRRSSEPDPQVDLTPTILGCPGFPVHHKRIEWLPVGKTVAPNHSSGYSFHHTTC